MFVIRIYKNLEEYRNLRLCGVLGDELPKNNSKYFRKDGRKFYETTNLYWAEYWKNQSSPTKIVNEWNKLENKRDYRSKFSGIWGEYLVVEKLTQDEWNELIDAKIKITKNKLEKQIQDLELERRSYK